jgi:hypothetical protein
MSGLQKFTIKKRTVATDRFYTTELWEWTVLTEDKCRARNKMLKANHYPERSAANAMLHPADETFSSNMQF